MKTEWKVGDTLRITDCNGILGGQVFTNGDVYDVEGISVFGKPIITVNGDIHVLYDISGKSVEVLEDTVFGADHDAEYESARNTELGEPSEGCNCVTLAEIAEELTDIKAMIGRILRNGGEAE